MSFPTTVWSRIVSGEYVARHYEEPIHRFLLSKHVPVEDARELTQEVLLTVAEPGFLARADRSKGRFRSLLLAVTSNVWKMWVRKRRSTRAGSGLERLSLGEADLDECFGDPAAIPADEAFDRFWVDALLKRALERLDEARPQYARALRLVYLEDKSYEQAAAEVGGDPDQIRNAVHRGKARLKAALTEEVRSYCSSDAELEDELTSLRSVFA